MYGTAGTQILLRKPFIDKQTDNIRVHRLKTNFQDTHHGD